MVGQPVYHTLCGIRQEAISGTTFMSRTHDRAQKSYVAPKYNRTQNK